MNTNQIIKVLKKHIRPIFRTNQMGVLLIAIILVNVLINIFPVRVDLSKNRSYSLSSSTNNILKNISSPIAITAYFSSDIPARIEPTKKEVVDFLNEYESAAPTKINLIYKDPTKDSSARREAISAGVPQIQFSEVDESGYKVTSSFFGLVIRRGESVEVVPQVINGQALEFDITSAIYKMERTVPQKIALINFSDFADPRLDTFSTLKRTLQKQFSITNLVLSTDSSRLDPSTYSAAIVLSDGTSQIEASKQAQLSRYLDSGGSMAVLVDGVIVTDDLRVDLSRDPRLDFLEKYGVKINQDLVLSQSAKVANFASGLGAFVLKYPFWLSTDNFDKESSDFSNISQLVFPWVSSLSISSSQGATILARSQTNSWTQGPDFNLVPNAIPTPQKSELGSQILVSETKLSGGGNLLVIPTSKFVRDQYLDEGVDNVDFLINVLNRYVASDALSGIRSRQSINDPLKPLSSTQTNTVKIIVIALIPMLVLVLGAFRLYIRNK